MVEKVEEVRVGYEVEEDVIEEEFKKEAVEIDAVEEVEDEVVEEVEEQVDEEVPVGYEVGGGG